MLLHIIKGALHSDEAVILKKYETRDKIAKKDYETRDKIAKSQPFTISILNLFNIELLSSIKPRKDVSEKYY